MPDQRLCDFADPQADPANPGGYGPFYPMLVKPQMGGLGGNLWTTADCPQICPQPHPERSCD